MGGLSHRGGGKQSWPAGGAGGGGGGPPTGPAGGSLAGTYPDPSIAAGAVDTINFAPGAVAPDAVHAATADFATTAGGAPPSGAAGGSLWSTYPNPLTREVRSNAATVPILISATSGADGTLIGTFGATGLVMAAAMALTLGVGGTLVLPGTVATTGDIRGAINRELLATWNGSSNSTLVSTDGSNNAFFGVNSAGTSGAAVAVLGGLSGATIRQGATTILLCNTTNIQASSPLIMGTGTYISLPGTVATVGGVRGANNVLLLAGRNNASGTIGVTHVDTGNGLVIGSNADSATIPTQITFQATSSGFFFRPAVTTIRLYVSDTVSLISPALIIGTYGGTQPSIGNLRVEKNTTILAALTAADGNMALIATDASSGAYFGSTAAGASQVVTSRLNGSTSSVLQSNATDRVTVSTSTVTTTLPIVLPGAAPATTGDIRATKNRVVMACLHTDTTTNLPIVEVTNADGLILGDGSWTTVKIEGPSGNTLTFDASNAIFTNPVEAATHFVVTNAGPRILAGTGSPESVVSAPAGSIYLNKSGGGSVSAYVKESGSGNTGWKGVINA